MAIAAHRGPEWFQVGCGDSAEIDRCVYNARDERHVERLSRGRVVAGFGAAGARRTVGLEIFDGHKLGLLGVSLGNGSWWLVLGEDSDRRLGRAASLNVRRSVCGCFGRLTGS